MKKAVINLIISVFMVMAIGAQAETDQRVVIYTSSDENELSLIRERLDSKFPEYDIVLEYLPSGNHAAKLKAEGLATECDIPYDLEYGYMEMLDSDGLFADLSAYDTSIFVDDLVISDHFLPTMRYGGAIIVNTKVLNERGLALPESYMDLLKPEYKDLISMPNPKASATGYMFYKNLVNVFGESEALEYFDGLAANILQFTSSGSGPVNSLVQEEVAIAIGMTSHAALKITEGNPFQIIFFQEGSPYAACGAAIVGGKEGKKAVQEVPSFLQRLVQRAK